MLIYTYIATLANINKKPNNRGDKIQRKKKLAKFHEQVINKDKNLYDLLFLNLISYKEII